MLLNNSLRAYPNSGALDPSPQTPTPAPSTPAPTPTQATSTPAPDPAHSTEGLDSSPAPNPDPHHDPCPRLKPPTPIHDHGPNPCLQPMAPGPGPCPRPRPHSINRTVPIVLTCERTRCHRVRATRCFLGNERPRTVIPPDRERVRQPVCIANASMKWVSVRPENSRCGHGAAKGHGAVKGAHLSTVWRRVRTGAVKGAHRCRVRLRVRTEALCG